MRILVGIALLMNAVLLISFFAMATAQRSGGDEGMWAVMLFYSLIIATPILSIIAMTVRMRRQPQKDHGSPRDTPVVRDRVRVDTAEAAP